MKLKLCLHRVILRLYNNNDQTSTYEDEEKEEEEMKINIKSRKI